jgi:hypothetical protein
MAGVAASLKLGEIELDLIQEAGLTWLRSEIEGFDQDRFLCGEKQPGAFDQTREKISRLRERGFQLVGITPGPHKIVTGAGEPGSLAYLENYRRMCAFLASEFKGLIDFWQVANEVDIWIFRASLSLEQAVDFLKAGLRGIKGVSKDLKAGINITLFPSKPGEVDGNTNRHEGIFIARGIYQDPDLDVDYAGFDSYPGTWRDGGAESWDAYLDALYELVRKPIIIQEFGYASAGDLMTASEKASQVYPCEVKKWKFAWRGAHSPEVQAEFIAESYRVFAQKPFVLGAIYYSWKDSAKCWQCGQPDCPAETAWGLVDRNQNLKPSYHALKDSLATWFGFESTGSVSSSANAS